MEVLIVSQRRELWETLIPAFFSHSMQIEIVNSLAEGLAVIRVRPPVLVILDTLINEGNGKEAHCDRVRKELGEILMVNAMVHSAIPTFLDEESFHDGLEGLGVLCALPSVPDAESISGLSEALRRVNAT